MSKETYFKIDTYGRVSKVQIERENMLREFYNALDCDSLENVRTMIPDVCLVVDECSKIRCPPRAYNDVASCFYRGALL